MTPIEILLEVKRMVQEGRTQREIVAWLSSMAINNTAVVEFILQAFTVKVSWRRSKPKR